MMQPTEMVRDFQEKFETPMDKTLWVKLIREETEEVIDAIRHLLKEISDVRYVVAGLVNAVGEDEADLIIEEDLELMRRVYSTADLAQEIFSPETLDEAFARVHASNMSKLGEDGKPIRREDGKTLKGPNYKEPDFSDLVR